MGTSNTILALPSGFYLARKNRTSSISSHPTSSQTDTPERPSPIVETNADNRSGPSTATHSIPNLKLSSGHLPGQPRQFPCQSQIIYTLFTLIQESLELRSHQTIKNFARNGRLTTIWKVSEWHGPATPPKNLTLKVSNFSSSFSKKEMQSAGGPAELESALDNITTKNRSHLDPIKIIIF